MPPFGLYPMPRNHLYGGRTKPKLFNTNDFKEEEEEQVEVEVEEVERAADLNPTTPTGMDGAADSFAAAVEAGSKKKADKEAKKEKKKREGLDKNVELERLLISSVDRAGGDGSSKKKKKKKDKAKMRRSEGAGSELSEVFQSTPAASVSAKKAQMTGSEKKTGAEKKTGSEKKPASEKKTGSEKKPTSEKKRKRESEVHNQEASTQLLNEEYLAEQKLPAIVLESLRNFASPAPIPEPPTQETTQPSKKKPKTKRKSEGEGDVPNVKKPRRKSEVETPIVKLDAAEHAPVPSDWIDGTDEKAVKTQKSVQAGVAQKDAAATLSLVSASKKTPVPLPQLSQKAFKIMGRVQKQNVDEGYTSDIVMVPETPPSHLSKKSYLLFAPNDTKGPTTASKKASKTPQQLISSPTPPAKPPTSSLASPELGTAKVPPKLPSIPNALTDANLRSFKEPLNEASKPRPRTKSGASTSSSMRTSSASMSIQEAFARVGKPYVRSAASNDPFASSAATPKKKASHTREEAPLEVFKDKFHEVHKAVEWDAEDTYLKAYLEWDAARRVVVPVCLHKMTGCTSKREGLLRASVEQGTPIPSQLDTPPGDVEKMRGAIAEAERAEDLLMLATKARVPVPLGPIAGRWTLYCPAYAAAHFDKYGYGARTLVISSIAGFRSQAAFTARLQLPPRTMSFALMMFAPPPHASFRATMMKTASEGYAVEVVFLWNGYLQMRLDLGLMLQGKSTGKAEGGGPMEFIGVHEKAMVWWGGEEGVEDVEREGKRMFRKYDGE